MSILTQKIDSRPRLTLNLVASGAFKSSPLTVIDAGSRGGFEKHWDIYGDQINLIGFEVDARECERLNRQNAGRNRQYLPVGLSDSKGKRAFYIQKHIASSSFYKSRPEFLQRFPAWRDLIPHTAKKVYTTDLDSFAVENNLKPDFIKLDIEGAELDVFRGGVKSLSNSVFGLSTEAVFYPWRENMPTFSDLDIFLRKLGFVLFDLPVFKWEKSPLSPYMYETKGIFGPTDRGQVIWTQAIYLKDAAAELKSPKLRKKWDAARVLKLASIMELYNLEDCAIELIQTAKKYGLLAGYDSNKLIDLATPPIEGREVSYKEYVRNIKKEGPPRFIDGEKVSKKEYERYKLGKKVK